MIRVVEDIDAGDAERFSGAHQISSGDCFLARERTQIVDLQLSGGAVRRLAEMMLDGVPGGFIGDSCGDASVQDSIRIEKFGRERKVHGDAVAVTFGYV